MARIIDNTVIGVGAALFDLDGTLFDSERVWDDIDIAFLKRRGYKPTAEYKRAIMALGNREVAEFTIKYYKLNDTPEGLMEEWAQMALCEYSDSIRLVPGAEEYIRMCHDNGIRMGIVTSLSPKLALPCLKNNGVDGLFEAIVTTDGCGLSKTSPGIYAHAADIMGVDAGSCVVFDDVAIALRSAKLAGMITVAMRFGKFFKDGELCAGDADFVVDMYSDAPLLLCV